MIDHTTLLVSDYPKNKPIYAEVLGALGYGLVFEGEGYAGFGKDRPQFWISEPREGEVAGTRAHVALIAPSKESIHAFYEMALRLGWRDNGAPGYRPEYDEGYYAAFVLDQDGNNLEALIRES